MRHEPETVEVLWSRLEFLEFIIVSMRIRSLFHYRHKENILTVKLRGAQQIIGCWGRHMLISKRQITATKCDEGEYQRKALVVMREKSRFQIKMQIKCWKLNAAKTGCYATDLFRMSLPLCFVFVFCSSLFTDVLLIGKDGWRVPILS